MKELLGRMKICNRSVVCIKIECLPFFFYDVFVCVEGKRKKYR